MTSPHHSAPKNPLPWYAQGLRFTCLQSGHCCSGAPGYVWITPQEIHRLAQHLALSDHQVIENYCRLVGDHYSLNENPNARGAYDCVFLIDQPPTPKASSHQLAHACRSCTIYPVRPLQCRTWPFWHGNLLSNSNWDRACARCPGMNHGRHYTLHEIESLRDAADWPANPTSPNIPPPSSNPESEIKNRKS